MERREYSPQQEETSTEAGETSVSDFDTSKDIEPDDKEKASLNFFRSKVMRALLLTGYIGVLEACGGVSREDVEKMPITSVENILENPSEYHDAGILRTEGYLTEIGEKRYRIPMIVSTGTTTTISWRFKNRYSYRLGGANKDSVSGLEVMNDERMETPETMVTVVGALKEVKDEHNNPKTVLEVVKINKDQ